MTPDVLGESVAFACPWLVVREVVVDHDGTPSRWYHVDHPGCSVVVPVLADGRVALLSVWRVAVRRWCVEAPAGRIDEGEDPADTARRELREELGGHCAGLVALGCTLLSSGSSNEVAHLFLATGVTLAGATPDAGEQVKPVFLPATSAVAAALDGTVDDAATALALLRAEALGVLVP